MDTVIEESMVEWKPTDIKDIIEDFLCSALIPRISEYKKLLNYFSQDPRHVKILYSFILKPDSYEVSLKILMKYVALEKYQVKSKEQLE